jgi:hypothetical protein
MSACSKLSVRADITNNRASQAHTSFRHHNTRALEFIPHKTEKFIAVKNLANSGNKTFPTPVVVASSPGKACAGFAGIQTSTDTTLYGR